MELVRTAMEELGPRAKPQAIQDHIKEKHQIELPKQLISNYKFVLKRKGRAAKRRGSQAAAAGVTVRLDDLEALRTLVKRIGAEQVKRLVAMME
jgi:hypothetical protein